jgi:hypothetical protein
MSIIPGHLRDNEILWRIIRKYRDPITGLIDWNYVNREYDYIDFHTSPFISKYNQTIIALNRMVDPANGNSLNEQAWAQRQLNAGIPSNGVLSRLS